MAIASLVEKSARPSQIGLRLLGRQPRYRLLTAFLALLLLIGALTGRYSSKKEDEAGMPYVGPTDSSSSDETGFLSSDDAKDFCERRRWGMYKARGQRRKIYDMFLINTELDWMEIRLNELNSEVDYFIILESNITFQAEEKPLYFQKTLNEAGPRWQKYSHKMIHQVVDFSHAKLDKDGTWEHERFTRNALFNQALRSLSGEQEPGQGDVLLVSDVDEIPRVSTLVALRNCAFPPRVTLRSQFYYYSFQWLHRGEQWQHPQATYFNYDDTILPEDLRSGKPDSELYNAAWHCSSCFPSMADMKNKITSFSHKIYNHPYILDDRRLLQKVRMGKDIFEREGEIFDRVEDNSDLPNHIKINQDGKYNYMLNRDPPNANFVDVTT